MARLNGKAATKPLAVLTAEERESVAAAQRAVAARTVEQQLLERGLQSLFQAIRDKYRLPETFSLDVTTGECWRKK